MEGGHPIQRTVVLGAFSLGSLGESHLNERGNLGRQVMQAIRYYLADKDSGRAEWAFPRFHLDSENRKEVAVQVDIDDAIWDEFAKEADRQRVSTDQLLQHAVLYFAADLDAGRLTQRILDDLI